MQKAIALVWLIVWSFACGNNVAKQPAAPPALFNEAHKCERTSDCAVHERCIVQIGVCTRPCWKDSDCNYYRQKCVIDEDGFAACVFPPKQDVAEREPEPDEASVDTTSPCLDEVGCLLADNPPACCARYARSSNTRYRPTYPRTISRQGVMSTMRRARLGVSYCARNNGVNDVTVQVTLDVRKDGSVRRVRVDPAPNRKFRSCMKKELKQLTFPKTSGGTTVTYPYRF